MSSGPRMAGVATTDFMAPVRTADRARSRLVAGLLPAAVLAWVAVLLTPAPALAIDEFSVAPGINPGGITAGPDGALWFVEEGYEHDRADHHRRCRDRPLPGPHRRSPSVVSAPRPDHRRAGRCAVVHTAARQPDRSHHHCGGRSDRVHFFRSPTPSPRGSPSGRTASSGSPRQTPARSGRITTAGVFDPPTGFPASGHCRGAESPTSPRGPDGALWFTDQPPGPQSAGSRSAAQSPATPSRRSTATLRHNTGPRRPLVHRIHQRPARQITTDGVITEYPGPGRAIRDSGRARRGALVHGSGPQRQRDRPDNHGPALSPTTSQFRLPAVSPPTSPPGPTARSGSRVPR